MPNILLTRIDNRLVHGQVGVTWTKTIGANLIVVADDAVAQDKMQQSLMTVTAKSLSEMLLRNRKSLSSAKLQRRYVVL